MKYLEGNWRTPTLVEVAKRIQQAGGEARLVGGAVADTVLNNSGKKNLVIQDLDVEVFGLPMDPIVNLFPEYSCNLVGKKFGIITMNVNGEKIDISNPRKDNKTGVLHKDFDCEIDIHMSYKEAARRRACTVDTPSVNILTGEIADPFNGIQDALDGILRFTDELMFGEDAVRALRVAGQKGRKFPNVCPKLKKVCSSEDIFNALSLEPGERIWAELEKMFTLAPEPSVCFQFLMDTGIIRMWPGVARMIGCPQRNEWHPEGDVMTHALLCVDAMASMLHTVPEHQKLAAIVAAFLHDIGKPAPNITVTQEMIDAGHPRVKELVLRTGKTAQDLLLTAIGHDQAGGPIAGEFLRSMSSDGNGHKNLRILVETTVEQHMQPYQLIQGEEAKLGAYVRLHNKMKKGGGDLAMIGRQCMCDACATSLDYKTRSVASGEPNWEHLSSQRCLDHYETILANEALADPLVGGKDLIPLGVKPGPAMGKLIKKALDIQYGDATLSKEQILAHPDIAAALL